MTKTEGTDGTALPTNRLSHCHIQRSRSFSSSCLCALFMSLVYGSCFLALFPLIRLASHNLPFTKTQPPILSSRRARAAIPYCRSIQCPIVQASTVHSGVNVPTSSSIRSHWTLSAISTHLSDGPACVQEQHSLAASPFPAGIMQVIPMQLCRIETQTLRPVTSKQQENVVPKRQERCAAERQKSHPFCR